MIGKIFTPSFPAVNGLLCFCFLQQNEEVQPESRQSLEQTMQIRRYSLASDAVMEAVREQGFPAAPA